MEKRQAKDYIKEVLNQSFNPERFELFIRNLLNDIEQRENRYSGNLIPEAFRAHIAHYKRIGKYTDPEGEELDILIIQTRSVKKLERTRTALRNFVVRHLKTFDKQYALAAFYSKDDDGAEWRFSLVKIDYETKKGKKGKIKVEEELVPAKRFSFLVGKDEDAHTAQRQLLPILTNDHANPLIVKEKDGDGSIEGAFSIQKVTDEFYEQYHELYEKLANDENFTKALKEEKLDKDRFIKKLLGQIVFLYFLQKKGWLGVSKDQKMGKGSKRFLQERFAHVQKNGENYYNDFLRYLFYEALAKDHNDEGITYYYKRLGCRIPFLNGGLFEVNFEWKDTDFTISNDLFRNEEKSKAGDEGTGILDVFDRYNFTIKEDEPLEKEVAVDPEMLGKVFENMLDIKERKSKGAFYTPREVVHYMCQESLIHYLDNTINDYTESYQPLGSDQSCMFKGSSDKKRNLNLEIENKGDIRIPKEDLEKFIRKGHLALEHEAIVQSKGKETDSYKFKLPESIRGQAANLDKALANIKICDPAIGSGAFPVGLLHELVTARQVLNSFLQRDGYSSYNLKRHAIQESIYGVDIDSSAVDIAQLRLWLSMIVDEEDYNEIEALPNLDYKIVKGNSLIGFPSEWNSPAFSNIENLKKKFFNETKTKRKKELKAEIDSEIEKRLRSSKRIFGYKVDFDFKLFFSEVWHKKGGFDVVIGNPPYVSISKDGNKEILKKLDYETYLANGDLYTLFFEKGNQILKDNGHLCYITSNKWLNASYGRKTRGYFIDKTNPLKLIDFGKVKIFPNATVFVSIMLFQKSRKNLSLEAVTIEGENLPKDSLEDYFDSNFIELTELSDDTWIISTKIKYKINKQIETVGIPLGEWDNIEFFRGITTGFNEAFHIDKKIAHELISKSKKNKELIEPLLRGRDIKRWTYSDQDIFMINSHNGVKEKGIDRIDVKENYPIIYDYLLQFYDSNSPLAKERKDGSFQTLKDRADQGDHWTNLRNCAFLEEFYKPKIIWIEISDKANFAFDDEGHFLTNSAYFISGDNLKYLLSILNSSVSDYYFFQITAKIAGGRKRYTKQYVGQIPIPQIEMEKQKPFELLADYVIASKRLATDIIYSFFESLLDAIVFELYFEDKIRGAGKEIIAHLENLQTIDSNESDEVILSTLKNEFERLYDPNHPVRNNLETLDSIEEIRVIKETLKNN